MNKPDSGFSHIPWHWLSIKYFEIFFKKENFTTKSNFVTCFSLEVAIKSWLLKIVKLTCFWICNEINPWTNALRGTSFFLVLNKVLLLLIIWSKRTEAYQNNIWETCKSILFIQPSNGMESMSWYQNWWFFFIFVISLQCF